MTNDEIARLAYLALIGVAVAGWVFTDARRNAGRLLRQLLVWAFIFLGAVGGYGFWQDIRHDSLPRQLVVGEGRIEVPRAFDGHYYLTAQANGVPIDFMVDTGATDIVLARGDAARLGIDPDRLVFAGRASTANGTVRTARAQIKEFRLGGAVDRNVHVVVNDGEMAQSLLGMRYLQRFRRIEIVDGRLILER